MSAIGTLTIRNRQRTRPVNVGQFRQITRMLLDEILEQNSYDLGVYFVAAPEMTRLNETFLQHEGSTDVITFSYAEASEATSIHGEIFICVDEALLMAKSFKTSWHAEILRYLVHGVLHLLGHDDHNAADRRKMKREENRLLRRLLRRFATN